MELLCPVCHQVLEKIGSAYRCSQNHSFDIARQGYVNLLTVSQKHSLHPGDTREQVLARRAFLETNTYAPIVETLIDTAKKYNGHGPILDVGCGEGYYSSQLRNALDCELVGLDISKEAVRCAASKYKAATWICATASRIPLPDKAAGILTSLFALTLPDEFHRCLMPDGLFLQVLAAEDHLTGLKSIIYPELLHKQKQTQPVLPGFSCLESIPIRFPISVSGPQVQNLFSMTPHVYRVSKEGLMRLQQVHTLSDIASCVLNVYRAK